MILSGIRTQLIEHKERVFNGDEQIGVLYQEAPGRWRGVLNRWLPLTMTGESAIMGRTKTEVLDQLVRAFVAYEDAHG